MSGWLREKRAQQALQRDYHALRHKVLAGVRGKLVRGGVHYDDADLEAFYNQAWHGVYGQLLEGVEVRNVAGLLHRATYCRALDDYRKLHVDQRADGTDGAEVGGHSDEAERLDDERKLREFVEGLKDRLSPRECEAATLCYLLGFSRSEAAERMGVEPKRMEKIMDAVSKKVGEFVRDIERGGWCEARGSLIRAYAFGLLDPEGPRHALATEHLDGCPACRAHVRSLRGLGAVLPPVGVPLGLMGGGGLTGVLDRLRDLLGATKLTAAKAGIGCVLAAGGTGAWVATQPSPAADLPAPPPPRAAAPRAFVPIAVTPVPRPAAAPATQANHRPKRKRRRRPAPKRRVLRAAVATPTPTPAAPPAPAVTPAPRPATASRAPAPPPPSAGREFSFESGQSP